MAIRYLMEMIIKILEMHEWLRWKVRIWEQSAPEFMLFIIVHTAFCVMLFATCIKIVFVAS